MTKFFFPAREQTEISFEDGVVLIDQENSIGNPPDRVSFALEDIPAIIAALQNIYDEQKREGGPPERDPVVSM